MTILHLLKLKFDITSIEGNNRTLDIFAQSSMFKVVSVIKSCYNKIKEAKEKEMKMNPWFCLIDKKNH